MSIFKKLAVIFFAVLSFANFSHASLGPSATLDKHMTASASGSVIASASDDENGEDTEDGE